MFRGEGKGGLTTVFSEFILVIHGFPVGFYVIPGFPEFFLKKSPEVINVATILID